MNWWLIRFTMLQKLSLIQRNDSKQNKQNNYYILQDTVDYINNVDDDITDEKIIVKQLIKDMLRDRDYNWLLATTFLNYVKNDMNLAETARQMNLNRNMAQNYINDFNKVVKHTLKKYSK
jgi:DNA-binding phage protein